MKAYRAIVSLALLPRAAHVAGSMLLVLGVIVWLVIPTMCSAMVSTSPAAIVDAGNFEAEIVTKTAELAPVPTEYGPPAPLCIESNATEVCCPAGCAAKRSPTTTFKADAIFRACAKAYGCDHVEGWTVFMRCQCPKGKS